MMVRSSILTTLSLLAIPLALTGCGSGGTPADNGGPPTVHTLAYVVSKCSDGPHERTFQQALLIRQGERPPVTVMELSYPPAILPPGLGICALSGTVREGSTANFVAAFQRLGLLRDGSGLVFEVTDDFAFFAPNQLIPPELESSVEGIFFVAADGSGLRRLGPASRDAAFRFFVDFSSPYGFNGRTLWRFSASPDGRAVAFTDIGPGPDGQEAIQVFTLDIATGDRFQVTHLPTAPAPDVMPFTPTTFVWFNRDNTLHFNSSSDPGGLNPEGEFRDFQVDVAGTGLGVYTPPSVVALPGSQIVPTFQIVDASGGYALTIRLPGRPPVNHDPFLPDTIAEVFLVAGRDLLQLTNFQRVDTGNTGSFLSADGQRVFFGASADPLGTNPSENCQWFSIDPTGSDLRQLTDFRQGEHSSLGCGVVGPAPGCTIGGSEVHEDKKTGAIVFNSSCDPFGTNPNGEELFIMRPDGTELRQLTDTAGMVTAPDGTVTVENSGPFVYAP